MRLVDHTSPHRIVVPRVSGRPGESVPKVSRGSSMSNTSSFSSKIVPSSER